MKGSGLPFKCPGRAGRSQVFSGFTMSDHLQGHSVPPPGGNGGRCGPKPAAPLAGASSVPSRSARAGRSLARAAGAARGPDGAALGNNVKSVDHSDAHERNLSRFASKWAAANLLKGQDDALSKRLSHCGYVARQFDVALARNGDTGSAGFDGLKTCASVWCCPCCSPRISARRKDELDRLLSGARAEGLAVVMLTLTARHDRETRLAGFLDALKRAKQRLRQRREWRALPFVGSVTATEVTHGMNGYHPHFHEILLLECAPADALSRVEALRRAWLAALAAVGLTGADAAFQVQSASAAGAYVGKFGAAEEIALHGNKRSRNGSRSPWQLLADARDGDAQAAAAWIEYALAFRGRRQLVWSPGLKARFGVDEVADGEAAAEVDPEASPPTVEVLRSWAGAGPRWKQARRRRVALVHAAEAGESLDVAEYGPTDALRWRMRGGDAVVLPDDPG